MFRASEAQKISKENSMRQAKAYFANPSQMVLEVKGALSRAIEKGLFAVDAKVYRRTKDISEFEAQVTELVYMLRRFGYEAYHAQFSDNRETTIVSVKWHESE